MRWAARIVPSGPMRTRYRQEFIAELYGLGRWEQLGQAFGVLQRSFALRLAVGSTAGSALTEVENMTTIQPKPWQCRIFHWHHFVVHLNPEGQRYRQCSRCGKDMFDTGPGSAGGITAMGGG